MPSYFDLQTDGETSKNDEKEKIQSVPASECESEVIIFKFLELAHFG